MARSFGYVQYKPNKTNPTRIVASFPTPPEAFGRWPDLRDRVSRTFRVDEEAEARAWLRRQRLMLEAGTWQPDSARSASELGGRITLAEYWPTWISRRRTQDGAPLRDQTRYRMTRDAENHILPYFGRTRLIDIDRAMIDRWLDQLPADQPAMRSNALKLLTAMLRTASKPGPRGEAPLIPAMPYDGPTVKTIRRHETIPATPEQIHTIYQAMPERYRLAVYLAVFCRGLRIGEVCALQRRHVDLDHGTLHVQQTRLYMSDDIIGDPKTARSRRDETIPSQIIPLIKAHLETIPADADAWLFTAVHNVSVPIHPNSLRGMFDKARDVAGRPDLRFHDLRHTALTWLAQDGATLRELMDSAGHTTTENALRYQHSASGRDTALADKLGARLICDDITSIKARINDIDRQIADLEAQRDKEVAALQALEDAPRE